MVQAFIVSIMSDRKNPARELKVIRTLQLPCHFQLVLGKREVAKVDATRGFAVVNRMYPDFRFAVRRALHTRRAFVKYLLSRFRKFLEKKRALAARVFRERMPTFDAYNPRIFPRVVDFVAACRLLWIFLAYPFLFREREAQRKAEFVEWQKSQLALFAKPPLPKVAGSVRMCSKCGTGFTKHGTRIVS